MRFTVALLFSFSAFAANTPAKVTFHKDVLPIMQAKCQGCHRPGEAAPMALLTYKDARPFARAIREAVLAKRMPPWFADPHVGKFVNDDSLFKNAKMTLQKLDKATEGLEDQGPLSVLGIAVNSLF